VPDDPNRVRNPRFDFGAKTPRSWEWSADSGLVEWRRDPPGRDESRGICLTSRDDTATGCWTQRLRCRSSCWYRVEIVLTASCRATETRGGAYVAATPMTDANNAGERIHLAAVATSPERHTIRTFYQTPPNSKWLTLETGITGATGTVTIHDVRVIANIAPDTRSHPLALPPPATAYPPPKKVRTICLADETAVDRPLDRILRQRFGEHAVTHVRTSSLRSNRVSADALIIASDSPPPSMRSLAALERAAADHLIMISLEAFSRIGGDRLTVRTVEQPDDPLSAKIHWANFISRGFALQDTFPLASRGDQPHGLRQRHIRKGSALTALRKEHGFETMIVSVADTDAKSDHPICLYKPIDGGGIIVFDVDPIETPPTTCDEPNIAGFILFNMLGQEQVALGQFTAPCETEREWFDLLKEFSVRYPALNCSGGDRHDFLAEVGARPETFGLPSAGRPMILIRSGLRGDDLAGAYGVQLYLKQLVRQEPFQNRYANDLLSRFRIAWVPLSAPWQACHWNESLAAETAPVDAEFEAGSVAAVIDITEASTHQLRITYQAEDVDFARQAGALQTLAADFSPGKYCYSAVPPGTPISRRSEIEWRRQNFSPLVTVDPGPFDTAFHAAAASAGAKLIRMEIPGSGQNFVCNSIWRTDLVATTLEHLVGLQYGLIAVNRRSESVVYGGRDRIAAGEAIVVPLDSIDEFAAMRCG